MVEKIKKEIKPRVVKGRVILKLKEEPARAVTTSVPTGRISTVAKLGIASVDKILSDYKTLGITKLRGAPTESLPGGIRVRRVSEPETSHETSGFSRTYIVKVPPETDLSSMIKKLKENPNVENAQVDYFARMAAVPNDRYYQEQWGLRQIKCEEAWELEKGSQEVIIALVDTGVDQSHPDLKDKLVPGYDMVDLTDVEPGEGCVWEGDFYTRDNNAEDENGHGTHCAGIAAASTNNDRGVAGVAWNCKIMPVRVLANIRCTTPEGTYVDGSGTFTDIADGIIWAADHGAHVISMSLGGLVPIDGPQPELLRDAIDYAHSRGCVIVAAMGNDGVNPERYGYYAYPAAHPKVLAVGAVDQDNRRADFSNYGHYKHVMAPGVEIRSTYLSSDYADLNGTSMATPFVSGLAALIKSAASDLTPDEIIETIRQTAASAGNYTKEYGYGVVDALKAVLAVVPDLCQPTHTIQQEISPGAAIPDNDKKGIDSVLTISENGKICDVKVSINITHTWISDLVVALVSPSGEEVKLHDRTGASAKNIVKTYDTDTAPGLRAFVGMEVQGEWKLKVADHARRDVGTLNRWGLEIGVREENGGIREEISVGAEIPDNYPKGVDSVLEISREGVISDAKISVDITHTWIGDLVVTLIPPSGEEVQLHNRTGGSQDNIIKTYDVQSTPELRSFFGKNAKGTWTLNAADHVKRDKGKLNSWGIELTLD
jgi:subtilisin-like proprotein convertase family protein/subtilisin family serine protease